jgi:hypothetical protein
MRVGRRLFPAAVAVVAGSLGIAHAQPVARTNPRVPETLPELPRLLLTVPLAPKTFSFGALPQRRLDSSESTWMAEAHWLEEDGVSLLTRGAAREALELDCRQLCQPFIERSIGTELRLSPSGASADAQSYLFGSGDLVLLPGRRFTRFELGLGGSL